MSNTEHNPSDEVKQQHSFDSSIMEEVIDHAKFAEINQEVPIAAAIKECHSGEIIALEHNKTETESNACFHAEMLAINAACKTLNQKYLPECEIFCSLEPCPMCATAISLVKLKRLTFAAYDAKAGGVFSNARIYANCDNLFKPEIYGGIMEIESQKLLQNFFKNKRPAQ